MKSLLPMLLGLSLFFVSCSKKDNVKLESFSTEAFAFDTGSSWEVNVSTRVKGFQQNESNGKFNASISYQIDLVKPTGETIKDLVSKVEDKSEGEKIVDTPIDTQFELDSTHKAGTYKVIVNIKDVLSGKTTSSETSFELKKD